MKKLFLKNPQQCPVCGKNEKTFVVTDAQQICSKCFVKQASKEFFEEHPNNRRYGKRKPFARRKIKHISKKIYAIDGITSLYRGGCTN